MRYPLKGISHLQIPWEEIESGTNDLAKENIIGKDHDTLTYKGQLLRSGQLIDIVAECYDRNDWEGTCKFHTSVLMLSSLKHKNISSFIGFYDDPYWIVVINKYEPRERLNSYLSDPTLTWMQRLQICVGVAHGLNYLHSGLGGDYSVIHSNVKSSSIWLDDNWEPKLCNFGNSIKVPVAHRHRPLHAQFTGTVGYMDPLYEKTRGVTHKSDVFSFGVVLFEVLCGKEGSVRNEDNEFLADLAKIHYEKGTLDAMIDPDLWEQMDKQSFNIFSETAYYCLKEQRTQRPNMHQIVKRLEKAMELQTKYENLGKSTAAGDATSTYNWKEGNFEHLKIKLSDIVFVTNNFAEACRIGSGGYGVVYKAKLHLHGRSLSAVEGKNKGDLPMNSHVAIKRIFSREDMQGENGFFAEVEMLSSCKHQNIISLLGFCNEGNERILVYEYASNGSLDDYLGNTDNMTNLTWVQRIKICLDIAHGLNYLHNSLEDKQKIIHRDIKSANILLDENWQAKISDFGLSKFQPMNQLASTIDTITIAGTQVYLDPEYLKTGKLKKEADVYSFGVVMFEILCGRLAYDRVYLDEDEKGLGPIARRHFGEGTLEEMIDPNLKEETDEIFFTGNRGLNKDSMAIFFEVAYECLAETQAARPTMEVIIKKLEQALSSQENNKDHLKIPLQHLKFATQNFSEDDYLVGNPDYWWLYKGRIPHAIGRTSAVAKLFEDGEYLEHEFFTELKILHEYKHENVIALLGYCKEMDGKAIVYADADKGCLVSYLTDVNLTWIRRLNICIDVARGLDFLHGGGVTQEVVIHRNIRTSGILLDDDWKARIADFGLSIISTSENEIAFDISDTSCEMKYIDPVYTKKGTLTKESDIYSFGLVLFEILGGDHPHSYSPLDTSRYKGGKLDELVFEGIKEQIVPQSLTTFYKIAIQCLHDKREERPTANEVVEQLQEALEVQKDYEIWEPKLPKDYKEIIEMSQTREIPSNTKWKDLYDKFSKGILIQEDSVWLSLGSNGERNKMVSARKFSYQHRWSHKWRSVPESRFHKVAEMLDISNLKIQIKLRTQHLSPGINYGVHLIFRFCGPRKSLAKQTYVNLKYKIGSEMLNAYFARWREDGWMMIELYQFLNHKEDTDVEFLLESFSRCYCESRAIYIEGIEFRVIDNEKHEKIDNLKEVQQGLKPNPKREKVRSKVHAKKHHMLSAKEALYNSSNVSRFPEVIELLSQQVLQIKCKIKSQKLSSNTEYVCFAVFKLSENCHGLHYPVIVRDLLRWNSKKTGVLYFRSPSPWNLHDANRVPQKREDGWMEVMVWKFNSNHELRNDYIPMNMKLISYEGTMSGLIVRGLEFRAVYKYL